MGPFDAHFIVAVLIAGVASLAAHAALGATQTRWPWTASLAGAATLLACAIGLFAAYPPASFPPKNVSDWPAWIALLGAAMLAVAPTRRWRRALVATLLAGGCALLVLHPLQDFSAHAVGYAIAFAIAGGVGALLGDLALDARGGFTARAVLAVTAAAAFGVFMLAGSFQIASRAGVVPAAVIAPVLIAWWRAPVGGLTAGFSIAFAGFAALAYGLTDWTTPPRQLALAPAFALIALAPAAAWLARLPALRERPRLAATVAIAASLLVAGAGVSWLALHQPVKAAGGDDYGW